jgi:outer membrane receptor protein involved in Fe transport
LWTSAAETAAQEIPRRQLQLPSLDLSQALREVALQTGRNIIAPDELVRGRRAPALSGDYTAEQAVAALLDGSGLSFRPVDGALIITKDGAPTEPVNSAPQPQSDSGTITVTGTRIRGAPIASPVIRVTDDQIRSEGQATLAEAVRAIPQNFGGGQNPGVGNNVPAASGVNVGSATAVNLRGLGSDATLTIVNGHRLSYSASRQAIDISSIPLGAVDRIEIVPDGASAIYGSDAVAGVVNVILKKDYDGLLSSGRLGSSTDGGHFEQRYGLAAGTRWGSGGLIATYEFGRTTAIKGEDRSYTEDRSPALTLFPFLRNHSATISGHQQLGPELRLEVDALYNNRFSTSSYALNAAGDITQSGARFDYESESFVIAPTLRLLAIPGWNLFVTGSYGRDHTRYDVTSYFGGTAFEAFGNCYCNNAKSVEIGGDGSLVDLPAGPARVAVGAGYRTNHFERFNGVGASTNVLKDQGSYYAYGELNLPLVAPGQALRLVDRLSLSGALRYERYPGVDEVITPKLGGIYAPTPDFAFKASWGKSFRAPTLYQQYQARNVVLAFPIVFGGSGFPPGSTALLLQGGNPDLKPERATSWSTTLDVHPQSLQGLRLELSYFDTRYRDRVVTPITFLSRALSDPLYSDRLTFDPSPALLDEIIASSDSFGNATGAPYDPNSVAVFIDSRNVNAGHQRIRGSDLLLSYQTSLGADGGELGARLNATYLDSEQQLTPAQPVLPLAGIIFNPPHFRARGGLSWSKGLFTLTGDVTHIGGVKDTRRIPTVRVEGMTTLDLTLRIQGDEHSGWLSGWEAILTAQNLFDAKPDLIATTLPHEAPYDSTNYSALGRFLAVSLSKKW